MDEGRHLVLRGDPKQRLQLGGVGVRGILDAKPDAQRAFLKAEANSLFHRAHFGWSGAGCCGGECRHRIMVIVHRRIVAKRPDPHAAVAYGRPVIDGRTARHPRIPSIDRERAPFQFESGRDADARLQDQVTGRHAVAVHVDQAGGDDVSDYVDHRAARPTAVLKSRRSCRRGCRRGVAHRVRWPGP